MTQKNNNWFNYLLVFALMLLPLQNGMATVGSIASASVDVAEVCHESGSHQQHAAEANSQQIDLQQHSQGCCDTENNCQQQCVDCAHCPVGSALFSDSFSLSHQEFKQLYSSLITFPDAISLSSNLRPPRV